MSDQFYNMMEELAIQKMATEIPQYRQAGANTEKMEAQLRRVQANREIRQQIQLQIQMLKKQLHQVMPPPQQSQIKNYVAASSSIQTAQLPLRMAENQGLVMNNILQHHHDQGQLLYPGHDAPSKAAMMSTSQQQQQNNPEASSSLISRVPINSQLGSVPELPIGTNNSAITSAGYYQDAAALLINHGTWLNPAKALAGSTASPPLGINKQQPLFLPPENGLDHLVTTQWPHHDVVTYPNNVVVPTTPSLVPHYGGGGGYYNQLQTTPLDNILLEYYHKYGVEAAISGATNQGQQARLQQSASRRGILWNIVAVFSMVLEPNERRTKSLNIVLHMAVLLIVIGGIFLGLDLSGVFPASVSDQKLLDIYTTSIAKYSIYILAGLLGAFGAWLGHNAIAGRQGGVLLLALSMVSISIATALASMALTCYDIYKSVNIPFYTASWWSYLIDALILLQRLIYSLVGLMACITLSEAYHDTIHITPAIHVSSSGLTAGQQVSN